MKSNFSLIFFFILIFSFVSCVHNKYEYGIIKGQLETLMNDTINVKKYPKRGFIKDEKTAVELAEETLFKIYGKDKILAESPYQVNLIDTLWIINGTTPKWYTAGGEFWIIINQNDGRVLRVTHYK